MFMRSAFSSFVVLSALLIAVGQEPPVVPPPVVPPPLVPGAPMPSVIPPAIIPPPVGTVPAPGMPAPTDATKTPPKPFKPPTDINGRTLATWIGDFKSTDPTVRDTAVKVIPMFGFEAARKSAMKSLIALIDDPDPGIRINAILVVSAVGFDKVEDVKAATLMLASAIQKTAPGSMIRLHAVRCLAGLGPDAIGSIGTLIATAGDPSWETRQAVCAALGRVGAGIYDDKALPAGTVAFGPPPMKREPSLTAMSKLNLALIKDDSAAVRMEACQALVVLGPPITADPKAYVTVAQPFMQAIGGRLKLEKDPGVKIWLHLLNIMYDERVLESTVKTLVADLSSSDVNLRVQALNALGVLGGKAKTALGPMMTQLHHEDLGVASAAINNILMFGSDGREAIPEFEKLIAETKNKDMKTYATEALKTLKKFPAQLPVVPPPMVPNAKRP